MTAGAKDAAIAAGKKVLICAAIGEAAFGMALLIIPSLAARLLLGEELTAVAVAVARVTGIALIGLGIACWPGPPLVGMLIYTLGVALYLAYLALAGIFFGVLLWPAVILHLIVAILLIWASTRQKGTIGCL